MSRGGFLVDLALRPLAGLGCAGWLAIACNGESGGGTPRPAESARVQNAPLRSSAEASGRAPAAPAPEREAPDANDPLERAAREPLPATLAEQRARILRRLETELGVSGEALSRIDAIFRGSEWMGQGNPKARQPAMTIAECVERRRAASPGAASPGAGSDRCGAPNMVPVFDPSRGERAEDAAVCIDQYEFPNVPCEYPVVWVRASEAAALCSALGKRLCDAHEWEGACAGRLLSPEEDYRWAELPKVYADPSVRKERRLLMEHLHNEKREIVWAYGRDKDHRKCGTAARKDPRCTTVDWGICGTNSYPTGAFPACVSPFGVYDLHGNVAEHMSLPIYPSELGGKGWTEMKGSWFLFEREETHPDDCRWRAKNWHTTRVDHWNSHRNYHLGFRCCRDVPR